jgi:hypothetical protein
LSETWFNNTLQWLGELNKRITMNGLCKLVIRFYTARLL